MKKNRLAGLIYIYIYTYIKYFVVYPHKHS